MWNSSNPEKPAATPTPTVPVQPKETRPMEMNRMDRSDVAHIGKSVVIKGELSGSEDLHIDGEVEGSIDLKEHVLTIGPHARVRANVSAKEIVVHGKVEGNLNGTERVELKRSAVHLGDISTQRIVVEDGAYLKGAIDIHKDAAKPAQTPRPAEPAKSYTTTATGNALSSPSQPGLIPRN